METLAIVVSRNTTLLRPTAALDAPAPLLYTDEARSSRLLASLPSHVVKHLQDKPIAMEYHEWGVLMQAVKDNAALSDFFKVVSLSIDKQGAPYVSTLEARAYPITATQWHPEKNAFEWARFLHIPHSPDAVEMSQEVANFFISEARKNKHAAVSSLVGV